MRAALACALLASACNFPRPDLGDDAGTSDAALADADIPPGISIHVAGTGDDANDGIAKPVKTLKHAIGLAAANPDITSIVLASGRYSTSGGETFPYTLPANLVVLGAAGGGTILAGSNAEPGFIIGNGAVRDLELEDFTVALTVTGNADVAAVHVRTKSVAMRASGTGKVAVLDLDIAGASGSCAAGIELSDAAEMTAVNLVTRGLETSVAAKNVSVLHLSKADFTSPHCDYQSAVLIISTSKPVMIEDSSIDGGDNGLLVSETSPTPLIALSNTNIKNLTKTAVDMRTGTLTVSGGLFSNQGAALILSDVDASIAGITATRHAGAVIQTGDGRFRMRNSTLTENAEGFYISSVMPIDLGKAGDAGGNVFQNGFNTRTLDVEFGVPVHISAVGNTWRPGVQGADAAGHYATQTISGPVGLDAQQANFKLPMGASVDL